MRSVNSAARDLIRQYEGYRLTRYDDVAGFGTIGIGHKITPKDDIGDSITQEQCEALFEKDLDNASSAVEKLVGVDVTANGFGALVSFTFNLGAVVLSHSTLLRFLNAGNFSGAADEFTKWVYAGGQIESGLVKRRAAEKQLFLTPDQGD